MDTVSEETLREWARYVPVLALKALADGMPGVTEAPRARVVDWLVANPETLIESRRIELAAGRDRTKGDPPRAGHPR